MIHSREKNAQEYFAGKLADLKSAGLYRRMKTVESEQGPEVTIDGKRLILMCSNNYLGLAGDPALAESAKAAIEKYGSGAAASRLVSGDMTIHRELENKIAKFKNAESCVLFNSGYQANIGILTAFAEQGDIIYSDELNHASIIDGARLSKAEIKIYPHTDTAKLTKMMSQDKPQSRKIIVTDAVFSMDGDVAPLRELVEIKTQHNAMLIIDEAHATGVVGLRGEGLAAMLNLEKEIDVVVGTLGKALGGFGAFATGAPELIDWLINKSRAFIFSTALPPSIAAVGIAAIDILLNQPKRIAALRSNALYMSRALKSCGVEVRETEIPIIPIVIGNAETAIKISERLFDIGIFCQAIRPPSVPPETSRLRLTVMATHTKSHLDKAINAIAETIHEFTAMK